MFMKLVLDDVKVNDLILSKAHINHHCVLSHKYVFQSYKAPHSGAKCRPAAVQ